MSGYSVIFALKTKTNNLLVAADRGSGGYCTNDSGGGNDKVNILAATIMDRCFIIEK